MAASGRWRSFLLWFRAHANLSLALATGLAIGIGCRYPTGWALPDNTMAVFAAVIGAFATAAAVVIGVELQSGREDVKEATRQAELRMRLKIMLQPFFLDLQNTHRHMVSSSKRAWAAKRLVEDTTATIDRIRSSRIINEGLDNSGLVGLAYIEIKIATIIPLAKTLVIVTELADAGRSPVAPIHKVNHDLAIASNELMDEVFLLAGGDSLDNWKLPLP